METASTWLCSFLQKEMLGQNPVLRLHTENADSVLALNRTKTCDVLTPACQNTVCSSILFSNGMMEWRSLPIGQHLSYSVPRPLHLVLKSQICTCFRLRLWLLRNPSFLSAEAFYQGLFQCWLMLAWLGAGCVREWKRLGRRLECMLLPVGKKAQSNGDGQIGSEGR